MPGLGSKLRIKRLAMGLSPRDAARQAGIKQKYIWALEDEEILKFSDKTMVADSVKAYATALGLDQAELLSDFEKLWSDAGTAKLYMQQKYNRKGLFAALSENKTLGYGIAAAAAAILIFFGGYLAWGNFINQGGPDDDLAVAVPVEETVETATETAPESAPETVPEAAPTESDNDDIIVAGADSDSEEADQLTEAQAEPEPEALTGEENSITPKTGGYRVSVIVGFGLLCFVAGFWLFCAVPLSKKRANSKPLY